MARAFPLFSINHFAGGTEVTIAPGPATPTSPINPKTRISCHESFTRLNKIMDIPVTNMHIARIHLAPYLSSKFPKRGLVAALEKLLIVEAQPNEALLIPNESLQINGELKYYTVTGSAGSNISRGFCAECGSPLVSFVKENSDIKFIKAGSIDDSTWINADSNFWSSTAKSWSPVDETIHTFTHNPDFA